MPRCEECQSQGITGRQAYQHRLRDGQRLYLCLSHALVWRLQAPDLYPLAYGPEARRAQEEAYPPVVASLPNA